MGLLDQLKRSGANELNHVSRYRTEPFWKGPYVDGITQSMLGRFLACRERFRISYIEGLGPPDVWNHRTGYGDMWHLCEEALAGRDLNGKSTDGQVVSHGGSGNWLTLLTKYTNEVCRKYPTQLTTIQHWFNVCKVQFPIYVTYWAKHPDVKSRVPLFQENKFTVTYELPGSRKVKMLGKQDSVDLIGKGRGAGIYLKENKTKGEVDERVLSRQLQFDIQSMFYLVALEEMRKTTHNKELGQYPLMGINYNVVKRPLSGGEGTIRQHKATKNKKAETDEAFYKRLGDIIREKPQLFFIRWRVEVTSGDLQKFKTTFLEPVLKQLCDWWKWIKAGSINDPWSPRVLGVGANAFKATNEIHWRHPFGVYNPMDEGRESEVDGYLATGSDAGLVPRKMLFPELQ